MVLDWKPIDEGALDGEDVLAWSMKLGYVVVSYDPCVNSDFPWQTLDGPCYYRDGFELYARLPSGGPSDPIDSGGLPAR